MVGAGARRLHVLSPVLDVARLLVFLLIVASGRPASAVLLVPVLALVVGARYLAWARFTYQVDADSLVTEGGILNYTRRVVPLDRIQQVDLQRKLRHRAFGLAVLRIDTAGAGSEPEVTLDALADADAVALRALLAQRPAPGGDVAASPEARLASEAGTAPASVTGTGPMSVAGPTASVGAAERAGSEAEKEREVLSLATPQLALGGVTGSKLAVIFAAAAAVFGLVRDLPGGLRRQAVDSVADGARSGVTTLVVVTVLAVPVVMAVAAVAAVLTDGGFRLTRRGEVLHVSRGLLDQREASLAIHRVQAVRVQQNLVRRALGLVSVTLQSAGGSGQVEQQDSRVNVPVLASGDLDALLAEALPGAPPLPPLHPAPPAARRRAWLRRLVPALLVAVAVAVRFPPTGLLALLLVPVAAVGGELAYRGLGWATVGEHLVVRRGGLVRETSLVPVAKVQSTRLVSSPLQRRAGLATLQIDVAGRGRTPTIADGDARALAGLHRTAQATTAARRDERAERRRAGAAVASEVAR